MDPQNQIPVEILSIYSFALKYAKLAHVQNGNLVKTRPLEDVTETVSSVMKLCFPQRRRNEDKWR